MNSENEKSNSGLFFCERKSVYIQNTEHIKDYVFCVLYIYYKYTWADEKLTCGQ